LGAQHVVAGRNKKITTKTAMQKMITAYEKHKVSDQIPATFEVISVIAKV
jgi:malonyl-CoA O-methyltransferase